MRLFWNDNGRVACPEHAPMRYGSLWRLEGWFAIEDWAVEDNNLTCENCEEEA